MGNPLDDIASMEGPASDIARSYLENPALPGEMPSQRDARLIETAEVQRKAQEGVRRLKAQDFARNRIPYATDPVTRDPVPITDPSGKPLQRFNPAQQIAYDSAGKPKRIEWDATGQPALSDPFAGIPVTTNPKTGVQTKKIPGIAPVIVGTDPEVEARRIEQEKDKEVAKAATLLGRKVTLEERAIKRDEVDAKARAKKLQDTWGIDPEDLASAPAAIEAGYQAALQDPRANDKRGWFGGELSPESLAYRQKIEAKKQAALEEVQYLQQTRARAQQTRAAIAPYREQQEAIQTAMVDKQLAEIGIEVPQTAQLQGGPGPVAAHNREEADSTSAPATPQIPLSVANEMAAASLASIPGADKLPDVGFTDVFAHNPASRYVPFGNGVADVAEMVKIGTTFAKLSNPENDAHWLTPEGQQELAGAKEYMDWQSRERTLGGTVAEILSELPSFAGELAATWGLYSAGAKVGQKAAKEVLTKLMTDGGRELLEKKLAQFAIKGAGAAVGAAAQLPVAGGLRIAADTLRRMHPGVQISEDDEGQLSGVITNEGDGFGEALRKSIGNQYVELLSERTGAALGFIPFKAMAAKVPGLTEAGAKLAQIKAGLVSKWLGDGKTIAGLQETLQKVGWNGVLGEMFEERVAGVMEGGGAAGEALVDGEGLNKAYEDFIKEAIPSGKQLLAEGIAFGIPGAAIGAGKAIFGKKPGEAPDSGIPDENPPTTPETPPDSSIIPPAARPPKAPVAPEMTPAAAATATPAAAGGVTPEVTPVTPPVTPPETIDEAARSGDAEATEAQQKAGNAKLGRFRLGGMVVGIETASGQMRRSHSDAPQKWEVQLKGAHYGRIQKAYSKDGELMDIFVAEGAPRDYDGPVYVVNQGREDGSFDEHKVIVGADSPEVAEALYSAQYNEGFARTQSVATFSSAKAFRKWAQGASKRTAPAKGDGPLWTPPAKATEKPTEKGKVTDPRSIVPAIRVGGKVIKGQRGDTHKAIFDRHVAENPDDAAEIAEFDSKSNPNFFVDATGAELSREELAQRLGVKSSQELKELQDKLSPQTAEAAPTPPSSGEPAAPAGEAATNENSRPEKEKAGADSAGGIESTGGKGGDLQPGSGVVADARPEQSAPETEKPVTNETQGSTQTPAPTDQTGGKSSPGKTTPETGPGNQGVAEAGTRQRRKAKLETLAKQTGIEVTAEAVPNGFLIDAETLAIRTNLDDAMRQAEWPDAHGGNGDKWLELGADEELSHSRSLRASKGQGRNFQQFHLDLWRDVPAEIKNLFALVYPEQIEDHIKAAELARMLDQMRRLNEVTEDHIGDRPTAAFKKALENWNLSAGWQKYLERMQDYEVGPQPQPKAAPAAKPEPPVTKPEAGKPDAPRGPPDKATTPDWNGELQKAFQRQKAQLSRAQNAADWSGVLKAVEEFEAYWDEVGTYPDDWSRWERAKSDADLYIRRPDIAPKPKGAEKPAAKPPVSNDTKPPKLTQDQPGKDKPPTAPREVPQSNLTPEEQQKLKDAFGDLLGASSPEGSSKADRIAQLYTFIRETDKLRKETKDEAQKERLVEQMREAQKAIKRIQNEGTTDSSVGGGSQDPLRPGASQSHGSDERPAGNDVAGGESLVRLARGTPAERDIAGWVALELEAARPVLAALGVDARKVDPNGAGYSALEERGIWIEYLPDQKRIHFAPGLAAASTDQAAVRRFIEEEIIHAAQFTALEPDYRRDPKGAVSLTDFGVRHHQRIVAELATSRLGRSAIAQAVRLYYPRKTNRSRPTIGSVSEIVDAAKEDPYIGVELTRQVVQVRRDAAKETTEIASRRAMDMLRGWVQRALNVLRKVAKDPKVASPILDESIRRVESALRGERGGETLGTSSPEQYDTPLPPARMQTFMGLAADLAPKIQTAEDLARELEAVLGGKARKFSQSLWFAFKMVGATGPVEPKWGEIYAALPPKVESADPEAKIQAGAEKVADWVTDQLENRKKFTLQALYDYSDTAFGGTQAAGTYDAKTATDAMELGVNLWIRGWPSAKTFMAADAEKIGNVVRNMKWVILELLPTQGRQRSEEMEQFQQFSTPPTLALMANWVADVRASDTMMEPSAGLAGIAVFSKAAGAKVIVNELSARRLAMLKLLKLDGYHNEDAEQLHNILDKAIRPTVVVMNPPFSQTAGRMGDKRDLMVAARHIEQMLKRLVDGGRLVAIVGRGMTMDSPTFKEWWKKIGEKYSVRAVVGIDGAEYQKYGTKFDNLILVIDKVPPGGKPVATGNVDKVEELATLLQEVKNDRPTITNGEVAPGEVPEVEPDRPPAPAPGGDAPEGSGSPELAGSGELSEGQGGLDNDGPTRPPAGSGGKGSGRGAGVGSVRKPKPAGGRKRGDAGAGQPDAGERGESGPVGDTEIESVERTFEKHAEDAVFDRYIPTIKIKGSQPNITPLAESSAMASVSSPTVNYSLKLNPKIITDGILSDAQLESVTLQGAAHEQILPSGERMGYFNGDGTGVGKTRQVIGGFLDNWNRGRKRGIWVTATSSLLDGAKKGMEQLLWNPKLLMPHGKTDIDADLPNVDGILFTTYTTLGMEKSDPEKGVLRRIDQIRKWLPKDFDGLIAFDESHLMGNAVPMRGARGVKPASRMAMVGIELQEAFPNARIAYYSATGATEVSNLAYATRLGLWGRGTAFPNRMDFITNISGAGVAAMEMIARDLKALGVYVSRSISYHGITYNRLEHKLTPEQIGVYDELADAWHLVLENVNEALDLTEGAKNGQAVSNARGAFWSGHQRFFNQIITAMQLPTVFDRIDKSLADGNAVVIQLVGTGDAATKDIVARKAAEAQEAGIEIDYESMDFTPRKALMDYIERGFPVQQYEEFTDEEGNVHTRPVLDSEGKPVLNAEAVAMREALLNRLAEIRVPDNPLDSIINHYGPDKVAEVTGRTMRIVTKDGKKVKENWSKVKGMADANAFQDDQKQVLIFSAAGGTGMDYHADLARKNQRKRDHIVLQPGWRADAAVQGFGRTHRNNQKQEPGYDLASTNLNAQRRFISSIARRLDQLGALTKGQRDTGSQGMMSALDNLENEYSRQALHTLYRDIIGGTSQLGFTQSEFESRSGQKLLDRDGNLDPAAVDVKRFLNRLFSFRFDLQNKVWDAFFERLEARLEMAKQRGELNSGMETIKADSAKVVRSELLNTDERTGAKTEYKQVELTQPTKIVPIEDMMNRARDGRFLRNRTSGMVWAYTGTHNATSRSGAVTQEAMMMNHRGRYQGVPASDIREKWEVLTADQARPLLETQIAETPKTYTEQIHMITGALLPIWGRLRGDSKIFRVTLDSGERVLGRVEDPDTMRQLLADFAVAAGNMGVTVDQVKAALDAGRGVRFADGTRLFRRRVNGELRYEITGPKQSANITGAYSERIQYEIRNFIRGEQITDAIDDVMVNNPPVEGISETLGTSSPIQESKERVEKLAAGPKGGDGAIQPGNSPKDAIKATLGVFRKIGGAVRDYVLKPPVITDYKDAKGKWLGTGTKEVMGHQKADDAARELRTAINRKFSRAAQEAMNVYREAAGDQTVLREQLEALKAAGKKKYASIWEKALNLTKEEVAMADEAGQFYADYADLGVKTGMLGKLREDYVNHFWNLAKLSGAKTEAAKAWGNTVVSRLKTSFDNAKARRFGSTFEGIMEGFDPHTLAIGDTMAIYGQTFNHTLADRAFVQHLIKDIRGADGRPAVTATGYAMKLQPDEPNGSSAGVYVMPHARTNVKLRDDAGELTGEEAETKDYVAVDHPALRKAKWVGTDTDGKPVILEGDLIVHPDFAKDLANTLGRSRLQNTPVVRQLRTANNFVKRTILSLSTFHAVTEGLHAIAHGVNPNPKTLPKLDFEQKEVAELVNSGLMLAGSFNAKQAFMEGLAGGGLFERLPGIGPVLRWWNEWLFEDYIPRLKQAMALKAFARNLKRFPELSRRQVAEITARQSNDAFGEQNYRYKGENPTAQDVARMSTFAWDFLRSRAQFFGDALKPRYGKEQRKALLLMAVGMAVLCKVIEKMLTGENHWDKPFYVVVDSRMYGFRTVPGDVIDAVADPRRFVNGRLSPLIARPVIEGLTGRDWRGVKVTPGEQLAGMIKGMAPIPMKSMVDDKADVGTVGNILNATGIHTKRYSDLTETRKRAREWQIAQGKVNADESYPPSKYLPLKQALEDGNIDRARDAIVELVKTQGKKKTREGVEQSLMKPFSGALATEWAFEASLSPADRAQYKRADTLRRQMLATFNSLLAPLPDTKPPSALIFNGF